jgi:hypothetical protein
MAHPFVEVGAIKTKLPLSRIMAPVLLGNHAKATCRCGFMAVTDTKN